MFGGGGGGGRLRRSNSFSVTGFGFELGVVSGLDPGTDEEGIEIAGLVENGLEGDEGAVGAGTRWPVVNRGNPGPGKEGNRLGVGTLVPKGDGGLLERGEPTVWSCDLVPTTEGGKAGLNCGTGGITFGCLLT